VAERNVRRFLSMSEQQKRGGKGGEESQQNEKRKNKEIKFTGRGGKRREGKNKGLKEAK